MADADSSVTELPKRKLTPEQSALVESVCVPLRKLAQIIIRRLRAGDIDDLTQIGIEVACRKALTFVPGDASFLTAIYVRAEYAMIESIQADRREKLQAQAALRASREVHNALDLGDILDESAEARIERRDEARYALAGAAIIGFSLRPRTPEEMLMDEQHRVRLSEVVEEALAKLEDDVDRRLVVMCTMEDVTIKDAAAVLGVAYEPARERLRKAVAKVGRRLKRALG